MEDLENSEEFSVIFLTEITERNTDCILKREEGEKKKLLDISLRVHLYITKRELQT